MRSSNSLRRRQAHGANGSFSSGARPCSLHSFFFRRWPSFMASACNWFIICVRICTMRCRCHSSCRRSRFSGSGTHIRGKLSSSSSFNRSLASLRSVFCLRTRLVLISAAFPTHSSMPNSANSRSNQRGIRSLPFLREHSLLVPPVLDRTSLLPHHCGSIAVRHTLLFRCQQTRCTGRSGDNPHL
jgi:hypothetical protein